MPINTMKVESDLNVTIMLHKLDFDTIDRMNPLTQINKIIIKRCLSPACVCEESSRFSAHPKLLAVPNI